MLSAWPKNLQLELVVDSEISTLDIQAWIRQTKAAMVRLGYTNGTDKCYFDNLVETLRNARGVSFVQPESSHRLPSLPALAVSVSVSRFDSTQL
jgi:hypothetical protein